MKTMDEIVHRPAPRLAMALVLMLLLGGCGSADDAGTAGDDTGEDHRHLLDAAREPLDKARQVEDISASRKDRIDAELEAAGDP